MESEILWIKASSKVIPSLQPYVWNRKVRLNARMFIMSTIVFWYITRLLHRSRLGVFRDKWLRFARTAKFILLRPSDASRTTLRFLGHAGAVLPSQYDQMSTGFDRAPFAALPPELIMRLY